MIKLVLNFSIMTLLLTFPAKAKELGGGYSALAAVTFVSFLIFAILVFMSVARMRNIRIENRRSKFIDPETGISNRIDFVRRFENNVSDFSRSRYFIAYFKIDANFLQVYHKDSKFSDVVKHIADTLSENSGSYEFAAHVTESGFAMALYCDSKEEATERTKALVESFDKYIDPLGKVSKGTFYAAVCDLADDNNKCEMIIFNLRKQCTELLGTDNQVIFCEARNMNTVQIEKELVESIKAGLENQEFKLYVQFIVDNETKNIVSAEALSRWENPKTGTQLPGKYLGAMIQAGLIVDFDYYMFEQVCKQLETWKSTSLKECSLSCNFTRITISEKDFSKKIREISSKYDFDHSRLVMEITEEDMEKNRETAMANMSDCKNMGFKIALDDFGTGYTSPINLCEYPLDVVKIDREILLKTEKKRGSELFKGLVSLAHHLNLKIVCEGVETETQHSYVSATDCDYIQGWYFSKAIPVTAGEEFAEEFSRKKSGILI